MVKTELIILAAILSADWMTVAGVCASLLVVTFSPEIVARWSFGIYDIRRPEDRTWPHGDRGRP